MISMTRVRFNCCQFVTALVLVVLQLVPGPASSDELSFCFNNWQPFAMKENDKFSGISIDVIKAASSRLNVDVKFVELPWNRCLQSVREGKMDAVIDAAYREEFLQGPVSTAIYTDTFWVHKESNIYSVTDLKNLKIGLVDGYKYGESLLDLIDSLGLTREFTVDDQINIRKIVFQRVDAVIADLISTLYYVNTNNLPVRPILPSISYDKLYLSFSTKRVKEQQQYNRILAELISEGVIDEIYKRYVDKTFDELIQGK